MYKIPEGKQPHGSSRWPAEQYREGCEYTGQTGESLEQVVAKIQCNFSLFLFIIVIS